LRDKIDYITVLAVLRDRSSGGPDEGGRQGGHGLDDGFQAGTGTITTDHPDAVVQAIRDLLSWSGPGS